VSMGFREAFEELDAGRARSVYYIEGQEAFINGGKVSNNPHIADPAKGLQWRIGYLNAAKIGRSANNMRSDMARFPNDRH